MRQVELGRSGVKVPDYCLGTMTYGTQTDETGAHAQLDFACETGLNFLDTAEMYPVNPVRTETTGLTEEIIGRWIAKTGRRDALVIATKHSGIRDDLREGRGIGPDTLRETLEGSLRRLQTDYIDLYQFHWPNRPHYHFRKNWTFDPSQQPSRAEILDNFAATMQELQSLKAEGKIRAFGLSNETVWGTMQWMQAAEAAGAPRVDTMQNEYSLMCRLYDTDFAELSHHEDVTLLAFSPLATGLLTGKYKGGVIPPDARHALPGDRSPRLNPLGFAAADAYVDFANTHGLDPVHMALAWCVARPFPNIPIFGATTLPQLEHIRAGAELRISDEVLKGLDALHKLHPMPY